MSFIGDVFGAYGARQIGRFNADLYAKQAELARKNAEIKKQVEKQRYLAALKSLVQEKGQKMNPDNGEIPPLCSCGA